MSDPTEGATARSTAGPPPIVRRNPWAWGTLVAGEVLLAAAIIIYLTLPATSSANLTSLLAQYTGVLMCGILGTGFTVAGLVAAAQDWSHRNR